ncbi:MAG TPA: response regulator, partial [Pyrinomonadaceae bacterium]|nr:response regulator [Pyrinomonadaceae bacterium]
ELHGGTVSAESEGTGRGATFTVTLPLVSEADEACAAACDSGPAGARISDPLERLDGVRAVVVDDDRDARELLKLMLERCGASVLVAGSSAEALNLLAESRPDVLISDIGMPGEDGYELIRQVRSLPADLGGRTPAVALTAYARTEDRLHALRAGYQIHVPKPVEMAELVAVTASLVRRERH